MLRCSLIITMISPKLEKTSRSVQRERVTREMCSSEYHVDVKQTKARSTGVKRSPRYFWNTCSVHCARCQGQRWRRQRAPWREPYLHPLILALRDLPPQASPDLLLLLHQLLQDPLCLKPALGRTFSVYLCKTQLSPCVPSVLWLVGLSEHILESFYQVCMAVYWYFNWNGVKSINLHEENFFHSCYIWPLHPEAFHLFTPFFLLFVAYNFYIY